MMACLVLGLAVFAPLMNQAIGSDYITNDRPEVGPPHGMG